MRKFLRVAVITIIWLPVVAVIGGLARGGAADFSGFEIGSKATAALFTFDSPSLGIPAKPTGEMNFAFSESTLRSGPSGYGLGSVVWPGQVAAALPAFLQSEIESQSGGQLDFPMDIPNYPVRAESFHPQGPPKASTDAGTIHMRSSASEASAEGVAHLNSIGFPAIGTMGNQSSMSSSGFDPAGAVAMAESAVSDVSLLTGGLITFDSVVTRATARSDGEKGTVAGTTTVTGAEVAGNAVVIDATGVHVADQGLDAAVVQQTINQALNQFGVSMELSAPVDTIEGAKASRSLGGLLVRIKTSTIEPLIEALPAELQAQIRGQITFDQDITLQFAPAVVSAVAAKNIEFPLPTLLPNIDGATGGTTTPGTAVGDSDLGGSVGTAPSGGGTSSGGTTVVAAPVVKTSEGVPLWLVILLMLVAFASSRPLTAFADRVFAARVAGRCTYETN